MVAKGSKLDFRTFHAARPAKDNLSGIDSRPTATFAMSGKGLQREPSVEDRTELFSAERGHVDLFQRANRPGR